MWSVAYSPDGRHIISGSSDTIIRTCDAMTGTAVGNPPKGHPVKWSSSLALLIVSASGGDHTCVRSTQFHKFRSHFLTQYILNFIFSQTTTVGSLTQRVVHHIWVPSDCRAGLHSSALLAIPLTSNVGSVSLDSTDCALGSSWTQVLGCAQP